MGPLKKLPFWGRKKVRNCPIFLYGSVTYPKCLFCKKNGFRWVNSSLGGAVKNLHPHIGGSHFALLSRHPEIRKRQSAVMHYPLLVMISIPRMIWIPHHCWYDCHVFPSLGRICWLQRVNPKSIQEVLQTYCRNENCIISFLDIIE